MSDVFHTTSIILMTTISKLCYTGGCLNSGLVPWRVEHQRGIRCAKQRVHGPCKNPLFSCGKYENTLWKLVRWVKCLCSEVVDCHVYLPLVRLTPWMPGQVIQTMYSVLTNTAIWGCLICSVESSADLALSRRIITCKRPSPTHSGMKCAKICFCA